MSQIGKFFSVVMIGYPVCEKSLSTNGFPGFALSGRKGGVAAEGQKFFFCPGYGKYLFFSLDLRVGNGIELQTNSLRFKPVAKLPVDD
ncbi:hypothetical protein ACLG6S_15060 [Thermodesulfobacteriota bacterium B35]